MGSMLAQTRNPDTAAHLTLKWFTIDDLRSFNCFFHVEFAGELRVFYKLLKLNLIDLKSFATCVTTVAALLLPISSITAMTTFHASIRCNV